MSELHVRYPRRRLLSLAGSLAWILAACGGSDRSPAGEVEPLPTDPEPTAIPYERPKPLVEADTRPGLEFTFADGLPASQAKLVEGATNTALKYFRGETGVYVRGTVRVRVDFFTEGGPPQGLSQGNSIVLNAGDPTWRAMPDWFAVKIVFHEYFHCLQEAITRRRPSSTVLPAGDFVMQEGGADYAGFLGMTTLGYMSKDEAIQWNLDFVRRQPKLPPIGTFSGLHKGAAYPLALLAIDSLVGSGGVRLLGEYLYRVNTMDWRDAFSATFGRNLGEFHTEFEVWRQAQGI